jgi:branched-chain amino acid transport system ATP-binding protein
MSAAPALEARDLTAGYGGRPVLHEMTLRVGAGEMVALLGANGAGKTTVLRALSGQIRSHGDLLVAGTAVTRRSPEHLVRLGVAHVPQGRGTFGQLTVTENLKAGAATRRLARAKADIDEWFGFFPQLATRREQQAGNLSGGEQQMLAVARAMMSRPSVLLLDEPSLGLAPVVTEQLFTKLLEINTTRATAMLIVEQNAVVALEAASRAYVLTSGSVTVEGEAGDLRNDESVRRAYLRV